MMSVSAQIWVVLLIVLVALEIYCRQSDLVADASSAWNFLRRHFAGKPVFSGSRLCEKRSARGGGRVSSLKNLVRLKNSPPLTLWPTLIGRAAGHHCCCSVDISIFNYFACVRNRCVNFKLAVVKFEDIWCKFKIKRYLFSWCLYGTTLCCSRLSILLQLVK